MSCTVRSVRLLLMLMICALGASLAQATPQVYFALDNPRGTLTNASAKQAEFLSVLTTSGIENFERPVEELESYLGIPNPTLIFTGSSITAASDTGPPQPFLPLSVSPTNFIVDIGPNVGPGDPGYFNHNEVFTFNQPITAFGAYIIQAGDGPPNFITFRIEDTGNPLSVREFGFGPIGNPNPWDFANVFFWGVADPGNPFNRLTIIETNDLDGILMDDAIAGLVVPEPQSWLMAAVGAVTALGFVRRRRA